MNTKAFVNNVNETWGSKVSFWFIESASKVETMRVNSKVESEF